MAHIATTAFPKRVQQSMKIFVLWCSLGHLDSLTNSLHWNVFAHKVDLICRVCMVTIYTPNRGVNQKENSLTKRGHGWRTLQPMDPKDDLLREIWAPLIRQIIRNVKESSEKSHFSTCQWSAAEHVWWQKNKRQSNRKSPRFMCAHH